MIRSILVLAALLAGCMESHGGKMELRGDDCYTCHKPEFEATTAPKMNGHAAAGFPTTCANCHRITGWQPALGLHPPVVDVMQDFGIESGPHAKVKCLACHDLDSPFPATDGGNTLCTSCHPDSSKMRSDHDGATGTQPSGAVVTFAAIAYTSPTFCLACHPNGLAGKHPDNKFPRRDHHAVSCGRCHDRSTPAPFNTDFEGKNVNCTSSGCHPNADGREGHTGSRYSNAKSNPAFTTHNFCLQCHPRG